MSFSEAGLENMDLLYQAYPTQLADLIYALAVSMNMSLIHVPTYIVFGQSLINLG